MIDIIYNATLDFLQLSQSYLEQSTDKVKRQAFDRQLRSLEAQLRIAYEKRNIQDVLAKAKMLTYVAEELRLTGSELSLEF